MPVVPNTPAEKAGIQKENAIVQIDGEKVTQPAVAKFGGKQPNRSNSQAEGARVPRRKILRFKLLN